MRKITEKDLRQFGLALGAVLFVFGLIHFLKARVNIFSWFWGTAFVSVALAVLWPAILRPVYFVFVKVAYAIGWVNTRIILILIYYLLVTPIGLVMRLFGKDPLSRGIDRNAESYWAKKELVTATRETLEKQF